MHTDRSPATVQIPNRLRELAEQRGVSGYLLDGPEQIQKAWLEGKNTIGVTAGASAPEVLVQQVIDRLKEWGASSVSEHSGREETITFVLPRELRGTANPRSFTARRCRTTVYPLSGARPLFPR